MSDFTFASLILSKDVEIAKEYLASQNYLLEFNEKWICLLADDYDNISENVIALSEKTPVLFFAHPEDHGFGYTIIHGRKEVSSLYIEYEFDDDLAVDARDEYVSRIFENMKLDYFKLFEYSETAIAELGKLLTTDNLENDIWNMADEFMRILDINDLRFMSWNYVADNEENYPIIAKK
jgi:hypothetical protein